MLINKIKKLLKWINWQVKAVYFQKKNYVTLIDKNNNRIHIHKSLKHMRIEINGEDNDVVLDGIIEKDRRNLKLIINGSHNEINIGYLRYCGGMSIYIGNNTSVSNAKVIIGGKTSFEGNNSILVYQNGSIIQIGNECMISKDCTFRSGEVPHLLFDNINGDYIDISSGIIIGNHVWIGENSYICKKAIIPDNCIIGVKSIVTRRFNEPFCVIAGSPAKVKKSNIRWVRNRSSFLDDEQKYRNSLLKFVGEYENN